MQIQLTDKAVAQIRRAVRGKGGFQSLLRRLQPNVSGNTLEVSDADLEKLSRYSSAYGRGGFQSRTKTAAGGTQQLLDYDDNQTH